MVRPAPALVMEYHLGLAPGTLRWSGPAQAVVGAAVQLADAEAMALDLVRERNIPPDARGVLVCPGECLPSRRFRNCWRQTGDSLPTVDMSLARVQRMNEVRKVRNRYLVKNDADYTRALKDRDTLLQARLVEYAKQLRDMPAVEQPGVDACATPDHLEAWQPAWPPDPV